MGMNYFNDKITCIVDGANLKGAGGGFIASTCWVQGFYVYKEMRYRVERSGYYGIPQNMDYDGINAKGELCATVNRAGEEEKNCSPMEKEYYLQYQYFPFFMALVALLYYSPYMVFKIANSDLTSLRNTLVEIEKSKSKDGKDGASRIASSFFTYTNIPLNKLRVRVFVKVLIKFGYLAANLFAYLATDGILHGNFISFGIEWAAWNRLPSQDKHDRDMKNIRVPKPANVLLPPMGFCDIHEASRDNRNTHINQHKFICEISQHILYQYSLILLWFLIIFGIALSLIGVIHTLTNILCSTSCYLIYSTSSRKLFKRLSLREIDYLEYIRKKNVPLHSELCQLLKKQKIHDDDIVDVDQDVEKAEEALL